MSTSHPASREPSFTGWIAHQNQKVADATEEWFHGATAATPAEFEFLIRLRELAQGWTNDGLSAERSMGAPVMRPLVGIELPHLTAPLRWLWVLFLQTDKGLSIDCEWGDDTRFNDWGPTDGNVYASKPDPNATPDGLAEDAARWVTAQSNRLVRREEWTGRRAGTRWTFDDSGAVLFDTRPDSRRSKRLPSIASTEGTAR